MVDADRIRERLSEVRRRVGPEVEILAATKYVEAGDLPTLAAAGLTLVGENRSDALIAKQEAHGGLFTWDFIGHLQSRKAREVAGRVRLIHALDSLSAARRLDEHGAVDCLLQVNVAGEGSKAGVPTGEVDRFLEDLAPLVGVRLQGLMTMPPLVEQPEDAARWFAALRELRDRLAPAWAGRHSLGHLSMGTSQDYAVAAREGATIVRLGSVLYSE